MAEREYKRWIGIGPVNPSVRTLRIAARLGIDVIGLDKPGFCAWYSMILRCTPEKMQSLESWWAKNGIVLYRHKPRGAWDCPRPHSGRAGALPAEALASREREESVVEHE